MQVLSENVAATYVSVFDDWIVCESACLFNIGSCRVHSIEMAENAEAPELEVANAVTDEYVRLVSGIELREEDGVVFEY